MIVKTKNSKETKALGKMLAQEIRSGLVICLSGELGSGKTTFIQGFLQGLKIKGPYTSPTFVVLKHYKSKEFPISNFQFPKFRNVYHLDAYRVNAKDIINLGWEEMIQDEGNIILIEWAERIKKIIPPNCFWINFKWINENEREIIFK